MEWWNDGVPDRRKIGFVSHDCLHPDLASPEANWLCLAQASPMMGGSLKAFGLGDGLARPPEANWLCSA